jgi:hypothetical protein
MCEVKLHIRRPPPIFDGPRKFSLGARQCYVNRNYHCNKSLTVAARCFMKGSWTQKGGWGGYLLSTFVDDERRLVEKKQQNWLRSHVLWWRKVWAVVDNLLNPTLNSLSPNESILTLGPKNMAMECPQFCPLFVVWNEEWMKLHNLLNLLPPSIPPPPSAFFPKSRCC